MIGSLVKWHQMATLHPLDISLSPDLILVNLVVCIGNLVCVLVIVRHQASKAHGSGVVVVEEARLDPQVACIVD